MGFNDYHFDEKTGKLRPGLVTKDDLEKVVLELDDPEVAARIRDALAAHAQTLHDRTLPMLKGSGFIVIDPRNPRFDGEELKDFEDAKSIGSNIAYQSGTAIIYAPVLVMRPKRETAESSPSELLKQLNVAAAGQAPPVAEIAAPGTPAKD